ncbi:MAG: DUF4258 domain-containing protein [Bacteroidetes bacterium]|nr:DUF4258 domain-containing protein [Bacteroidota bacterium]MBS1973705.1 DUF4258 domain-containing protein [Bacteroidota bacterium]
MLQNFFLRAVFLPVAFLFLLLAQCRQAARYSNEPIDRHASHLVYTRHARCRMDCRHITEMEIREVLENGEIDYRKSEPDAKPDPKYAVEAYTKEGQHLRVVFAPSNRGLVVITCIDLGVEWQCDCH